jgi:hypothetical protein
MNTLTINQKMFIAALVGFIIGATAVWVWSVAPTTQTMSTVEDSMDSSAKEVDVSNEAVESNSTPAPVPPRVVSGGTPMVAVVAQSAGQTVAFSALFVEPGWIAIHEDRNGEPGNVLGARWLPAGTHASNVVLLRNTVSGKMYYAVLYADDGDREFQVRGESALVTEDGNPIMVTFEAQ